ncbi:NAD(P)H-quinone oxidoreductase subunit 3 [Pedobacter sp. HMF7647]|uniref:NADH-quinone oxidoreductase subunit A n=1 Tax=Hufsiella arboris TaxID=2695275 RepID=A0A7K1Y9D1_9SPHI|nr:NADH-quinone oxidoreductase subunit A [Hufsiella arboris]MXV51185.1 NAD(P)H-quinone oxidoreductase subunit 3 [Hufsiella arboris]
MNEVSQLTEFGKVLIFLIMGVLFVLAAFLVVRFLAPRRPNPIKLSTYECGEETSGTSWVQFNPKFYVIAIVFLLFDVEMAFIFPWTTIYAQSSLIAADSRWGWFSLSEMFIFIGILIIGLVYVWKKGDLEWIRSKPIVPKVDNPVPGLLYEHINQEIYQIREFSLEKPKDSEPVIAATVTKPSFKPTFRKATP